MTSEYPGSEADDDRNVRITRSGDAVELYFPPLRSTEVALPLAAFGAIAAALPSVAIAVLLPSVLASSGALLSAVLIAGFLLPFLAFGGVFVALAIYMVANALYVRIDRDRIETARGLFGVVVKRRCVERRDVERIEPQIASRYQSLFGAAPSYHLFARTRDGKRTVVGETLRGEASMARVKALLDGAAAPTSGGIES